MKDAVGSSLLVYLVIIIVGIVGACVIASSAYSKAYKAKTNIISIIDRYYLVNTDTKDVDDNTTDIIADCFSDETCNTTVNETLDNMGYHMKVNATICDSAINKIKSDDGKNNYESVYPKVDSESNYGYCIYKVSERDSSNYYYTVITFSHLNINVLGIGTLFKTPVYGETRVYYDYSKGA